MTNKKNKIMEKIVYQLILPIFILSITAILTGWLYGTLKTEISSDIISGIDIFMTFIVFGTGIIAIIMAFFYIQVNNTRGKK